MNPGYLDDVPGMLAPVAERYRRRINRYGAAPRGVFWLNSDRQQLRFEVLATILEGESCGVTVNDLGCGYGAMFDFLKDTPVMRGGRYFGYDICEAMIKAAQKRIRDPRAEFILSPHPTHEADYAFAGGTYNLKNNADDGAWNAYIKKNLVELWKGTRKGLAFNMLNTESGLRQKDLYYGDSKDFLDFCSRTLSPNVTLLDNHPLSDWTILVRR